MDRLPYLQDSLYQSYDFEVQIEKTRKLVQAICIVLLLMIIVFLAACFTLPSLSGEWIDDKTLEKHYVTDLPIIPIISDKKGDYIAKKTSNQITWSDGSKWLRAV